MAITCADLFNLKTFKHIKLVAGEKGLNRSLTWPYVGQTASVADWVHGGELLFITGLAHGTDDLQDVLQECIVKRLSGLVILVGDKYIKQIPDSLIAQADKASFPLFEMPWSLKLIDVTREIIDRIAMDKLERKRAKTFLSKLLFSDNLDFDRLFEEQALHEVNIREYFFIAIFNVVATPQTGTLIQENLEEKLQNQISSLCKQNQINLHSLLYGNNIICLFSADTDKETAKAARYIRTVQDLLHQINTDMDLYLSFGRTYSNPLEIRKSYQEARQALDLCKKISSNNRVYAYSDLGTYRLLLNIKDKREVQEFYHYHLDPILQYDAENSTELLVTLRQYLHCNSNLAKTAQALFIHRNTLLYRLNQIKDLLNIDLDDALIRLNLFNSIVAKEYLSE